MMTPEEQVITVKSRKYNGVVNRQWDCKLVEHLGDQIVLKGVFESSVDHPNLGVIRAGTVSYEYFWMSRWYNIFRFHEPSGALRNYYCNICAPPSLNANVLDYVDLDIDVVVWPNGEQQILDEDEFRENSAIFEYSETVISHVKESLRELLALINDAHLPT